MGGVEGKRGCWGRRDLGNLGEGGAGADEMRLCYSNLYTSSTLELYLSPPYLSASLPDSNLYTSALQTPAHST